MKAANFEFRISNFAWALLAILFFSLPLPALGQTRIVSLKPNITEILFALGAGPELVGVTSFCDRPEAVKNLPKVADYIRVDPEAVLKLKADLVLGSKENSSQKEIEFLKERGVEVRLFSFSTIADTLDAITAMGKLLGKEAEALRLTSRMQAELEALRKDNAGKKWHKALFVVGYQPLVVAGSQNFLDDAAPYLAAFNVAHASKMKYPVFSTEQVIRAAPEVIVDLSMGSERTPSKLGEREKWWRQFASIPAVRWRQIYNFEIEKLRAGPDLPQALRALAELIHRPTPSLK